MTDKFRMPRPLFRATTLNFTMGHLISKKDDDGRRDHFLKDDSTEWLLGHRLPPFQRPPKWTIEQDIHFITNAWMGVNLSTYCVNRVADWLDGHPHPTDLWLMDGQQRFRAVKSYINDGFPINGLLWSELTNPERNVFDMMTFSCSEVHETDEDKLRAMYDAMNYGGTPHTEDERAVKPEGKK